MSSSADDSAKVEQENDNASRTEINSGDDVKHESESLANLQQAEGMSNDDKPKVELEQESDNKDVLESVSPQPNDTSGENFNGSAENTSSIGESGQLQDRTTPDSAALETKEDEINDAIQDIEQENQTSKTIEVPQDSIPAQEASGREAEQEGRTNVNSEVQKDSEARDDVKAPSEDGQRQSQTSQNNEGDKDIHALDESEKAKVNQESEVQQGSEARDDVKAPSEDGRRQSQTSQNTAGDKDTHALNESEKAKVNQESEVQQDSEARDDVKTPSEDGRRQSQSSQKNEGHKGTDAEKSEESEEEESEDSEDLEDGRRQSQANQDPAVEGRASEKGEPQDMKNLTKMKNDIHVDSAVLDEEVDVVGSLKAKGYHTMRFENADELDDGDGERKALLKKGTTCISGVSVGRAWPTINRGDEDSEEASDQDKQKSDNEDAKDTVPPDDRYTLNPPDDRYTLKKDTEKETEKPPVVKVDSRRHSGQILTRTFVEEVKGGVPRKKKSMWGRMMGEGGDAPKKSMFGFKKTDAKKTAGDNPPGSVSITIVGTQGYPKLKKNQKVTRYCVCDVIGSRTGPFKTPKVENIANPTWNHPIRVLNYHHMSCIQFAVMDEDIIGLGCLNTSDFSPNGFKGLLDLKDNNNKPLKAKLKLEVIATPPLKGEEETKDKGQDAVSDKIMAKFTAADDKEPNDFVARSRNRTGRVVHIESDPDVDEDIDGLLRTPVSSEYEDSAGEEKSAGRSIIGVRRVGMDDERYGLDEDDEEDEEDEETLRKRNRAQCNIAGLEFFSKNNQGQREETDPLNGLPYYLGSRGWDPHLVWVCGDKVQPASFRDPLHKNLAIAALSAGTSTLQTNIERVRGSRENGWNLRWDCAASCEVAGPTPRRVDDKYTTKRVTNTPIPTWNEICNFPDVTQDSSLEFAVQGIDKDGWPKKEMVLGHAELPKESIGEQGFHGELKLRDTKHTVDAHLKVQVAVLALWDDEADQKVPLHECRAWLERMDAKHMKNWGAGFDFGDDISTYSKEKNTWEEMELGPCTVFDLLYADATRRRCNKKLNKSFEGIRYTSPVKKKEWVWKEVDNFLSRVYDDEDSVKAELALEPAKVKDPRTHLNCVSHPDDTAANQQDVGVVDLAGIRASNLIRKPFSSSSEDSEEWGNNSSSSSSTSEKRPPAKRISSYLRQSLLTGAKRASQRMSRPSVQQQADRQRAAPRGNRQSQTSSSPIEEHLRRSTSHGGAGKYNETRSLMQAKGIRPSQLANLYDSTSSAEEKPQQQSSPARKSVLKATTSLKPRKTVRSTMTDERIEIDTDGVEVSHVTSYLQNGAGVRNPSAAGPLGVIEEREMDPRSSIASVDLDTDRRLEAVLESEKSIEPNFRKVVRVFQPGKMGFANRGSVVIKVHDGGQAEREGVKIGWKILAVGDQKCDSFDDNIFQDAKAGDSPFEVTFLKVAEADDPEGQDNIKQSPSSDQASSQNPFASKAHEALSMLKPSELQKRALKAGATPEEIENALDDPKDSKGALVSLVVAKMFSDDYSPSKEKKRKKEKKEKTYQWFSEDESSESPQDKKSRKGKKDKKSKNREQYYENEYASEDYADPGFWSQGLDMYVGQEEELKAKRDKKSKKEKKDKMDYDGSTDEKEKKEKKNKKEKKTKRSESPEGAHTQDARHAPRISKIDTGLGPHSRGSVARQPNAVSRQSLQPRQSMAAQRQSIAAQRKSMATSPKAEPRVAASRQSMLAPRQPDANAQKVVSPSRQTVAVAKQSMSPSKQSISSGGSGGKAQKVISPSRQAVGSQQPMSHSLKQYSSNRSVESLRPNSEGFFEL